MRGGAGRVVVLRWRARGPMYFSHVTIFLKNILENFYAHPVPEREYESGRKKGA